MKSGKTKDWEDGRMQVVKRVEKNRGKKGSTKQTENIGSHFAPEQTEWMVAVNKIRSLKTKRSSLVSVYFVLYYTLNRSGKIHGKKRDLFEIRSPPYITPQQVYCKVVIHSTLQTWTQTHSPVTNTERSITPLKQHSLKTHQTKRSTIYKT